MNVRSEFEKACAAVSRSAQALTPLALRLKRESELTRRCSVCEDRRRLGECPSRRLCSYAQKLGISEEDLYEKVIRSETRLVRPISSTSVPLAAALVGGTNGASQET